MVFSVSTSKTISSSQKIMAEKFTEGGTLFFELENTKYRVRGGAVFTDLILLPDGKYMLVEEWTESSPPAPKKWRFSENLPENKEHGDVYIAESM